MGQSRTSCFSVGWRQLYEYAMLELDDGLLPDRITAARLAILDRAEAILTKPSGEEKIALKDALRALRILEEVEARKKTERESN